MSEMRIRRSVALLAVLACAAAHAHQPRLVEGRERIDVRRPEVSQAFYSRLAGRPQVFLIRSVAPLRLYVNLLLPDPPEKGTGYLAVISRLEPGPTSELARLDGMGYDWRPFYEPFGGDRYLLGPEFDRVVAAGLYEVVVSSTDNSGRYALAVGKSEKFPPAEILRTLWLLPRLKIWFGKSPWTAFFNYSGLFLLLVLLLISAAVFLIRRRLRRPVPSTRTNKFIDSTLLF